MTVKCKHTFSFLKVASVTIVLQEEGEMETEGETETERERERERESTFTIPDKRVSANFDLEPKSASIPFQLVWESECHKYANMCIQVQLTD